MADNQTIHQKVTIQAPSTKVFQALTEPSILEDWFPSQAKADVRQGGSYQYVFKFKDPQQGGTQEGQFLELRPAEKISYTWEAGGKQTQVDFTLTKQGEKTEVELKHSGFGSGIEADQVRGMHAAVWGGYLNNLKSYLEEGKDVRTATMGQITK
jgi:uncharacterized protein YndB with AHSA1/START domain